MLKSRAPKKGMWAALAASDSDTDTDTESVSVPVPKAVPMTATDPWSDPIFSAMDRGEINWGDMLTVAIRVTPPPATAERDPLSDMWSYPRSPLRATEGEIWEQPFSTNLEEYWPETYDTRAMSDTDYHALMGWLFSKGWYVEDSYDRAGVRCWPDNASSRHWDPTEMVPADEEPKKPKPRGGVTIPRFCREAHACSAAGCRYVHGNTIPRIKESCTFGESCGASDPTGVKRSQCLRMHPGETWTPELVISRI